MADDPPATTFAAPSHRSLRDAGLVGEPVTVSFAGRALHLSGAASGSLRIEAGRCERARFGYLQGKYHRHFVARIWNYGDSPPNYCPSLGPGIPASPCQRLVAKGSAHREFNALSP